MLSPVRDPGDVAEEETDEPTHPNCCRKSANGSGAQRLTDGKVRLRRTAYHRVAESLGRGGGAEVRIEKI